MKRLKLRLRTVLAVVSALMLITLTGCVGKWYTMDSAGLTQAKVEEMSLKEQYELLSQRFERMEELLTEAQLSVSDGEWERHDVGLIGDGTYGPTSLAGGTYLNSYYLSTTRSIFLESATGGIEDLDPILEHFKTNDWKVTITTQELSSTIHKAKALTDDGWHIIYSVQENGQYNLKVVSDPFWGTHLELQMAKTDRMGDRGPSVSVPGVLPPFPKWEDPIVSE